MSILSIQSHVTYGHVGNSSAVFPLQRIGHEVWPVHTVNFSNHTGYGAWGGALIPASQVSDVIRGVEERGAFPQIDAVISGYLGGAEIVDVVASSVRKIKEANPQALYSCDPVMGNAKSGCFVAAEIPPLLRDRLVPLADIITPNHFELSFLTKEPAEDTASTLRAIDAARAMGPSTVLVTSVRRPETPADSIEMIAADDDGAWIVRTPFLDFKRNGSGDVTAALFAGHYVRGVGAAEALGKTASSVFELIEQTFRKESPELLTVEAQEAYVRPSRVFEVARLR